MAKRKNSRFRGGSGLYMCRACTFLTRETGKGESEVAFCRECYDGEPGDDLELLTAQEFAAKWPKREAAKPATIMTARNRGSLMGLEYRRVSRFYQVQNGAQLDIHYHAVRDGEQPRELTAYSAVPAAEIGVLLERLNNEAEFQLSEV